MIPDAPGLQQLIEKWRTDERYAPAGGNYLCADELEALVASAASPEVRTRNEKEQEVARVGGSAQFGEQRATAAENEPDSTVYRISVFREDDGRFAAEWESADRREAGMGSYSATPVGALAELCATLIKVGEDDEAARLREMVTRACDTAMLLSLPTRELVGRLRANLHPEDQPPSVEGEP